MNIFFPNAGLTEGLHQANVTECRWAIEKDVAAAKAFKANYPDATVFTDDCNLLLNAVVNVSSLNLHIGFYKVTK